MANKQTRHLHIVLLLLSLLAQSFAYAYAPCPEQMNMGGSAMGAMPIDHSAMNMAESAAKGLMQDSSDNCCNTQQDECPKSSCATAALLSSSTIIKLHPAPQMRATPIIKHPKPAPLISLYRPPIHS